MAFMCFVSDTVSFTTMTQHINILFQSPEGQKLIAESDATQTLLIRLFKKQKNNSFCGVQSSALLLSAQHYGAKFTDPACQKDCDLNSPPYVEENMFRFEETKSALDEVKELTLKVVQCLKFMNC